MIVIPKSTPIIEGLNSFYLNVGRFIEHFSGEVPTGAIHFLASKAEGIVFVDDHSILNGIYEDKEWPDPQKGHAAMITRMDSYVGRILDLLDVLTNASEDGATTLGSIQEQLVALGVEGLEATLGVDDMVELG